MAVVIDNGWGVGVVVGVRKLVGMGESVGEAVIVWIAELAGEGVEAGREGVLEGREVDVAFARVGITFVGVMVCLVVQAENIRLAIQSRTPAIICLLVILNSMVWLKINLFVKGAALAN